MSFFRLMGPFLKTALSNPRAMGAVLPSSARLAKEMVACAHISTDSYVLELGPGTGVITEAILNKALPPDHLVVLELSRHFIEALRQAYPNIRLLKGDAADIAALTQGKQFDAILSSLPLRSLSKNDCEKILNALSQALKPGGRFVQFTYALWDTHRYDPSQLLREHSFIVWQNCPPARVNVFKKPQLAQ